MDYKQQLRVEKVLRHELLDLLDIIWSLAGDDSFAELADRSGLCENTIRRLWDKDFKYPRFLTLQKLAYAVEIQVSLTGDRLEVKSVAPPAKSRKRQTVPA